MEKFKVIIEKLADGTYLAYLKNISALFTFGNNLQEVKSSIENKIAALSGEYEVEYEVFFDR